MAGHRKFSALLDKMPPERRAQSDAQMKRMMDEMTAGSSTATSGKWPRFSLPELLLVTTAACILLALYSTTSTYTVTASVAFRSRMPRSELEHWAVELAANRALLAKALGAPRVQRLKGVVKRDDAVKWLSNRLEVEFRPLEIIDFQLKGYGTDAEEDRTFLEAFVEAYVSEVRKRASADGPEAVSIERSWILMEPTASYEREPIIFRGLR